MILPLIAMTSHASGGIPQYICVTMDEQFSETSPNADYWTANGIRPLRGIRVEVIDNTTGSVVADDYATGHCLATMLDPTHTYRVVAHAEAQVNGYTILAEQMSSVTQTASPIEHTLASNWLPPTSKSNNVFVVPWGLEGWAEVLVGQFMATRAGPGGLGTWPGNRLYYLTRYSINGGKYATAMERCFDGTTPTNPPTCTVVPPHIVGVLPTNVGDPERFVIAHETGHFIGGMTEGNGDPFFDMTSPQNGCDGNNTNSAVTHNFFEKEYQTSAAIEGFASYIVAATFNRTDEYDCTIQPYDDALYNYDLFNGWYGGAYHQVWDSPTTNGEFSCEGAPWDLDHDGVRDANEPHVRSYVSARDWLEDVEGASAVGCSPPLGRRGNEYDWMRYFWDMRTDENLSSAEVVDLYAGAFPSNWTESCTFGNCPRDRLTFSASLLGVSSEHNQQKNNGQDR